MATKKTTTNEIEYTLESLRESCVKLFGCSTAVFDGATLGMTGSYSTAEMSKVISAFLNKEI